MKSEWWRGAIIYQIYPRSFFDANGDGIGDIAGINQKLDYICSLGVDALWINPFFRSPMRDFGYDVTDHADVDPVFGDLTAFDRLVAAAHAGGLRGLIDFIPNHTSTAHAWLRAARTSRSDPHRHW